MAPPNATFTLEHAVEADIPTLVSIGDEAFKADRHTQLKAAHPTTPYVHSASMPETFASWINSPREKLEFIKAVDTQSGEILGFICWFKRFQPPPESKAPESQPENTPTDASESKTKEVAEAAEQKETAEEIVAVAKDADGRVRAEPETAESQRLAQEEAYKEMTGITTDHLAAFQKKIMANGARCMIIVGISVHPDHQGRGVGSSLVKYGTDIADEEGVFCWVHSSEAGARNFVKSGFVEVDHLTIDLDDWAEKFGVGPPPAESGVDDATPKWGPYTLRYFVRRAKGAWGS